ncbi:50S ribosomal protein L10 [bioreactor metagenome]|uniref:50S ribosomal protein L10 n=1 Tax=bioreactor metagenome TaxID=1076179 RepID=A0A645J3R5_9ZZZZ
MIGTDQIKYLAELPSKEVLVAKLLGTMNAPVQNLVGVLAGVPRALVCALAAIQEQKQA